MHFGRRRLPLLFCCLSMLSVYFQPFVVWHFGSQRSSHLVLSEAGSSGAIPGVSVSDVLLGGYL